MAGRPWHLKCLKNPNFQPPRLSIDPIIQSRYILSVTNPYRRSGSEFPMPFLPPSLSEVPTPTKRFEWEEIACPLCLSWNWQPILEGPDWLGGEKGLWFAVVRCDRCGLCFTNPRPDPLGISQFYPPGYQPYDPLYRQKKRRFSSCPKWLLRSSQQTFIGDRGKLLDFGCGSGLFLQRMKQLGWEVTGLDISDRAVAHLREDKDVNVLLGSLPNHELPLEYFHVITMWQSLEHVHNPREVLQAANELLTSKGKIVIAVPNIDSLPFRWFGPAWCGLDLPRHLTHFTPFTLQQMLEETGFQVDSIQQLRHSSWLRKSSKLASRIHRIPSYPWLQRSLFSRLVCYFSCLTNQADCMVVTAHKRD